jgi:radical SAM protein with 4Fe4S-binding SPASM domain
VIIILFSLTNDSFARVFGDIGYLFNQLNKSDRVYDQNGKFFIERLKHQPQSVDDIARELVSMYRDVSYSDIYNDYTEFLLNLEKSGFAVTGETTEELEAKMPSFSYSNHDLKTLPQTRYDTDCFHTTTADFLSFHFRQNPRIFSFQIELTSRCNEKCRHCYLPGSREMADMETALAMDLLDQLTEEGTVSLTLSGGECLLHKDFIPILERAREKDFSISILSNVTLLTDDLLTAIKKANINLLQVSVYSMIPEEHDWVTQVPGSHAATMQSLEKLIAADIPAQISCPTMKKTYKSYRDVLDWAYKHRMKGYTDFIIMGRTDRSTDNLENRLSYGETKELFQEILETDIEYKALLESGISFVPDVDLPQKSVCGAGTETMCVTANGDFYPCAGFQGYTLGNARRHSVREVWRNSEAIKRIRGIKWKDFPKCVKCEAKSFCSMCMVRNFNESGDIFTINQHFCDVAFLNKMMAEEYVLKTAVEK